MQPACGGENGLTMTNAVKALKPFRQLLTFLHFDIERFERKRFLGHIIMNILFEFITMLDKLLLVTKKLAIGKLELVCSYSLYVIEPTTVG